MDFSIQIISANWRKVYSIRAGTTSEQLQDIVYMEIRHAAGNIKNRFLCYSWGTESEIKYCGSIARDYQHGNYKSNLDGRVKNYFRNHRQNPNGRKNANLNVYEHILDTLSETDVHLAVIEFDEIRLGDKKFTYEEYSDDPELVQAVEQLLICSYQHVGQSQWNRTPSIRRKPIKQNLESWKENKKTSADDIRAYIIETYIRPSREKGIKEVHLRSGNIHREMKLKNKFPSICQVLDGDKFRTQARVTEILRTGPEKSSTVEWVFRLD